MKRRGAWLAFGVALLVLAQPRRAPAQTSSDAQPAQSGSTLVVVIPGEKVYHQPGCPLVAKAGSKVKVMKLAEAKQRGLQPHDCQAYADSGGKPSASEVNATPVYVQPGDNKYHKAGCAKLGDKATKITLGEAGKKYWPCPVCKPPIRQREKTSSQ